MCQFHIEAGGKLWTGQNIRKFDPQSEPSFLEKGVSEYCERKRWAQVIMERINTSSERTRKISAMAKQAMTIVTQIALKDLALDVEMCTSPWIVDDSKNSLMSCHTHVWGHWGVPWLV